MKRQSSTLSKIGKNNNENFHYCSFIGKDLVDNIWSTQVLAGIVTIGIAAAISMLSIAFTESALNLIESAIKPTRPIAGTIRIQSSTGLFAIKDAGDLTSDLTEKASETHVLKDHNLKQQLDKLIAERRVDVYSPIVTSMDGDVLPFTDHSGNLGDMLNVTVWSVPAGSPLIDPKYGLRYLDGMPFPNPPKQNDKNDKLVARLGVLVNLKYFKKYLHYDDQQLEELREGKIELPKSIRLQFPPYSKDSRSTTLPTELPTTWLKIAGIFDEKVGYPDLILSEDVAKAYFYNSKEEKATLKGSFPSSYGFHFFSS